MVFFVGLLIEIDRARHSSMNCFQPTEYNGIYALCAYCFNEIKKKCMTAALVILVYRPSFTLPSICLYYMH